MSGETTVDARTDTTQDETRQTDNTTRNDNSTQNNQSNRNKTTTYTDKYFSGQTQAIGAVLALQGETHVQKRVTFDRF